MSTILICEDQDAIRKMIQVLLEGRGHDVLSATNGAQALELVNGNRPALALLDLTMPGEFDGLEVCRRLRANDNTHTIPILIVTAVDDHQRRREAMEAGASGYFTKPFSPIALLSEIQKQLQVANNSQGAVEAS